MIIRGQHGNNHLYFHPVAVFAVLAVIFTTALTAAGLSGDQTGDQRFEPRKIKFELRLASYQKVEGWEIGFVPGQPKTPVWISPEVYLTNSDIARAWPQPGADGFVVGFTLTEEGSLKLARLTKSHIGEYVAIMGDGQVSDATFGGKTHTEDETIDLAVRIDETIKRVRPDSWRGVQPRELTIKRALYDILQDKDDVERIFLIIKAQKEY